jgi:hypothetical protein
MMMTYPGFLPKTVKELIAFARARPGQIKYSSSGNGKMDPGRAGAKATCRSDALADVVVSFVVIDRTAYAGYIAAQ